MHDSAQGRKDDFANDKSVRQRFDADVSSKKRYDKLLGEFQTYQKMLTQVSKSESVKRIQEQLQSENLSAARRKELEADLARVKEELHRQAMDATLTYSQRTYERATIQRKAQLQREKADTLKTEQDTLRTQYNKAWAAAQGDGRKRAALTRQYHKENAKLVEAESKAKETARKLERTQTYKHFNDIKTKAKDFKSDPSFKGALELGVTIGSVNAKALERFAKETKENYMKADERLDEAQSKLEELIAEEASEDEIKAAEQEIANAKAARDQAAFDKILGAELEKLTKAITDSFAEVESMITDYKGHIDARLQGSEKNYNDINNLISEYN